MNYSTGRSFRQALESHILTLYQQTGTPISRYRKLVSFDRFIARLLFIDSNLWVIKGGYMMELIYHQQARATKDIDLLCVENKVDIYRQLYLASKVDLGDWFQFEVSQPENESFEFGTTTRYNIIANVDNRKFDEFHLDITTKDILISGPNFTESTDFLNFAGIGPIMIPCYSIEQQISEKFHALTRMYSSGEPSRVKDLIDILLIANTTSINFEKLNRCIQLTFEHRGTHEIPDAIPLMNVVYSKSYQALAGKAGIQQDSLFKGNSALIEFLSPVLIGKELQVWNPYSFHWE